MQFEWLGLTLGLFLVAFLANGLSALAGGGAGLLQLPALLFLGLGFSEALTIHKIASVALGVGASWRYWKEGQLNVRFAWLILLFGLPGVIAGALLIVRIPGHIAEITLGLVTIALGVYSIASPQLGLMRKARDLSVRRHLLGGLGLFLIGILNGSITSGTGLIVTLWLVAWYGLEYKRAVAYTLILVGLFWNGTGALSLALQTDVLWDWLPGLLAGALVGGYAGAHVAVARGNRLVKRCFEALTILTGLGLLARYI